MMKHDDSLPWVRGAMASAHAVWILYGLHFFGTASAAWSQQPPPNVVFIVVDDLTVRLQTHGHPDARTPNLMRLAAKGVNFRRAYCQFPYCGPSRASLLTGLYPWRIGVSGSSWTSGPAQILPNHPMIPQHFAQHGYRTLQVGKINHSWPGFDSWQNTIPRTARPEDHGPPVDSISYPNPMNGAGTTVQTWNLPDNAFGDGALAEDAAAELASLAAGPDPFFVGIGLSTHTPWKLPRDLWLTFDPDDLNLPPEPPQSYQSWWNWPYFHQSGLALPNEANRRGALAAYDAAIHFMDRNLGKILDVLDEENLWDNTIVVFTSDHGFSLGEHRYIWSKGNITNETLQVPLLISAPGQTQGQECWTTVQLVDLYKSLRDLCGLPEWKGRISLDGRSLKPALVDPDSLPEAPAFSTMASQQWKQESPRRGFTRVVHHEGWKLIEVGNTLTGSIWARFMFDHNVDPEEYFIQLDSTRISDMLALFPAESNLQSKSYVGFDRLTVNADGSITLGTAPELPIDRDHDGMSDEIELSLTALGLDYLLPQPEMADLLAPFAPSHVTVPVELPAGPRLRVRVFQSRDLENWYPTPREARFMGNGEIILPPTFNPPAPVYFKAATDIVQE